jgi:hypothetical protein
MQGQVEIVANKIIQINPAVILGCGSFAEKILETAKRLICEYLELNVVPPILQFLSVGDDLPLPEADWGRAAISDLYHKAASKQASLETERLMGMVVKTDAINSFVILPMQKEACLHALEIAEGMKRGAAATIGGNRNAIFLTAKRLLSLNPGSFQSAAQTLDSAMSAVDREFPFNRCFFVDESNEQGQTISSEAELVELVARFVVLSIASDLSCEMQNSPPPYKGQGPHYQSYASFSCTTLSVNLQALVEIMASYLAQDISAHLFEGGRRESPSGELWQKGVRWFEDSMKQPVKNSVNVGLNKIKGDEDYQDSESRLDAMTRQMCGSLGSDLDALQAFLDECLEQALLKLEARYLEMQKLKEEISQLLINILLDISCGQQTTEKERTVFKERMGWIIFFLIAAVAVTIVSLKTADGQATAAGIFAGVSLLVAAYLVYRFGKKPETLFSVDNVVISCEEKLREKRAEYDKQNKILTIHMNLFNRLDLAHWNLTLIKDYAPEPPHKARENIFDLDIVDSELATYLYAQIYKNKQAQIEAFITPARMDSFHLNLFSYPDRKLTDLLQQYCRQYFDDLRDLTLDQICDIKKTLTRQNDLFMTAPYWYPRMLGAEDKGLIVLLGKEQPHMKAFFEGRFGAGRTRFVEGQNTSRATLVQISYGLKMQDLFLFAHHA